MKEKTKAIIIALTSTAIGVTGLTCLGYSIYQVRSMRRVLLGSAQKINELSHVDIDQAVVDNMVKKAVKEQATTVASKAATKACDIVTADMINRVKQLVSNKQGEIETQLATEILDMITKADKNEIVEDVTEKASEMLVEKLGDDLDAEVGRMGKIYKGIVAMVS